MPKFSWLNLFAKVIPIAIIVPVLLVMGTGLAYSYYQAHSVESFCKDVAEKDTADEIIVRANALRLFYTRWQGTDDIWVLNKPLAAAPMWRFACVVKFDGGKVFDKSVIDAD